MADEHSTDADFARLRSERFGSLPSRVRPDTAVETVETEARRGRPETAASEEQWRALHAGG